MTLVLRAALGALLLLPLAPLLSQPVRAQGVGLQFNEMKQDSGQPVEITSNQLEVDQAKGTAVFTGDVVVTQGTTRMSADRVEATYAAGTDGAQGGISTIHATGNVLIASGDLGVQGTEAVYTMAEDQIVMTGSVVVTQGASTITGQRLVVNVDSGTGRMEGRVRTVIQSANPPGTSSGRSNR
ncbi:organic solvent tolerance protein OstA [Haematobacter missouriensis]|uniref:Lipopolysaccharide transport periplasmic protein LptA n=1 Tax=Haematobacter missouriensis TaxID=366616 RepID=A0A212AUG5_9RHOB|nr:lipopolysaccharide transport periplasmic protein LptA [Haematobacter missouriensis]KFI33435.1 organic solvent tolerance protein OstA [Haematobacter missouriensis]OWJ74412.1 lipopolysaccharide transport periplasmic protein LptA [Haematobacter missouriensis]OWJ85114.1 lipopolysaccharide transport periplasmic protein LptA [Haematobacter missouriensis]